MPLSRCWAASGGERAPRKWPICIRKPCRSSRRREQRFRSSASGLGSCAGVPVRGSSSRRCALATGRSIPRKCNNEREVGEGLHASGVKRNEIFATTKIWPAHFAPRELERAARDCLVRLRLSEVDLLLLHWPNPQIPLAEALGALKQSQP